MSLSRLERARRQISRIPYGITNSGCHIPSYRTRNRNGRINTQFDNVQMNLSRLVAYAYLNLNIDNPNEMALHKVECHNRACFNKDHLYVGTGSDNIKDSVTTNTHPKSSRTLCPKGHQYDGIIRSGGVRVGRYCKKCKALNARIRRKAG